MLVFQVRHDYLQEGLKESMDDLTGSKDCAVKVVEILFNETNLRSIVQPGTIVNVSVGGGNWINYSFQAVTASPEATTGAILNLTDADGFSTFQSLGGIRSLDSPSLHVVPQSWNNVIGHVDAWNPKGKPFRHLFDDYLPSKGYGSHPSPFELLSLLKDELRGCPAFDFESPIMTKTPERQINKLREESPATLSASTGRAL